MKKSKALARTQKSRSLNRVVGRFFATDKELAETLANDIAEDIDCGESPMQLRVAIQYWANECAHQAQERAALAQRLAIFKHAKDLMEVALSSND